jgi:uncharacterized iron-regulated membrane protein
MRKVLGLSHRYVGLALAPLLIVVGLTGSLLAFHTEIDRALNATLLTVPARPLPMLDPFTLRERAEASDPRLRIDLVDFRQLAPTQAFVVWTEGRRDPISGVSNHLPYDELMLDPYTGDALGTRRRGSGELSREGFVDWLFDLHRNLLAGHRGTTLLGIAALLWTLDCCVGFALTLPRRGRASALLPAHTPRRGWWQRWRTAWTVKRGAASQRMTFDLHRAAGLWVWPMLIVLAWSGVAFNLGSQVYRPAMALFFDFDGYREPVRLGAALEQPGLDWRAAHATGQRLMQAAARQHGFTVVHEETLELDRVHGLYSYRVRSSEDHGRAAATRLSFDADSGAWRALSRPGDGGVGDTLTRWLVGLHMTALGGPAMRFVVGLMGLAVAALAVTGALIWSRKRSTHRTAQPAGIRG